MTAADQIPRVETATTDVLRGIVSMPAGPERELAVESFIASRMPLFNRHGRGLCRINSVQPSKYLEDVTAIVAEVAWVMIREALEDPSVLDKIVTWEAILYRRARVRVRSYIDNNDHPASGMVTARRRHREVQKTRSLLRAELDREPTNQEIIAETNKRLAHLKNASYQGMAISEEDLHLPTQAADPELAMDTTSHVDFAEDYILHPAEGRAVVTKTIAACYEHNEVTGRVAELWMGDAYSSGGADVGTDTITHIGKVMAMSRPKVLAHVVEVRRIAIGVLAGMGIEGLDEAIA